MVTGASTADVAIVLVDARQGVIEQTRRHASIASLLRVRHVVVAVNKMDLVGWDEEVFDRIVRRLRVRARVGLGGVDVRLPLSALHGDNVVEPLGSDRLVRRAAAARAPRDRRAGRRARRGGSLRLPVQLVLRDRERVRGYAGPVAGGAVRPGDEVVVLPAGERATVAAVRMLDGELDEAVAPLSVSVTLTARSTWAAATCSPRRGPAAGDPPARGRGLLAGRGAAAAGARLLLKHRTVTVPAVVDAIDDRLDLETLDAVPAPVELALNDIGRVRLRMARPLAVDSYAATADRRVHPRRRGDERHGRRGHGGSGAYSCGG